MLLLEPAAELDAELDAAELEPVPMPLPPRHSPAPPGNILVVSHFPAPQSASVQQNFTQIPLSQVVPFPQNGPGSEALHAPQSFAAFGGG